jgi:hypothetical protein
MLTSCASAATPKLTLNTPRDPTTAETMIVVLSQVAIALLFHHRSSSDVESCGCCSVSVEEMYACLYRCSAHRAGSLSGEMCNG